MRLSLSPHFRGWLELFSIYISLKARKEKTISSLLQCNYRIFICTGQGPKIYLLNNASPKGQLRRMAEMEGFRAKGTGRRAFSKAGRIRCFIPRPARDRHGDAFAPDFSQHIHRHSAAMIVNRHKVMVIDNSLGSTKPPDLAADILRPAASRSYGQSERA